MNKSLRLPVIAGAVFLALLFSVMFPRPAMAVGDNPPLSSEPTPIPPEEIGAEPAAEERGVLEATDSEAAIGDRPTSEEIPGESAPEEVVVEQTDTSIETGAPTEEPTTVDGATDEEVDSVEETSPLLAELPEDTVLVVLDEDGTALSPATQEAAEIIASGDPMWCPVGVTPKASTAGCSPSFGSLDALKGWLEANDPAANGVIWIEKTYSSSMDVAFDGVLLPNMATKTLIVQGGWIGEGTKTIDINSPSKIDHRLTILGWQNDVTLNDLLITSVASLGDAALRVETSGKITISRIEVDDNADSGAVLDNTAGTKDVIIKDGRFTDNGGSLGLNVSSNGNITVSMVVVSDNSAGGAWLDNSSALTAKNVTLTGVPSEFNYNGGHGLGVWSTGLITIKDLTAVGNDGNGTYLDNTYATTAKGVVLTGTNIIAENEGTGLVVRSNGPINANNLIANANGWEGVELDNCDSFNGSCRTTTAQPITLTGTNEFKFNMGGLIAISNGAITVNNITASNNSDFEGAYLDNYDSNLASTPSVTLTGNNTFKDNGADGLAVWSKGIIKANNLTAENNGWASILGGDGVFLLNAGATAPKAVILTGTNNFFWNESDGLSIYSGGAITVAKPTATGNGGTGAYLDNLDSGAGSPQNVTLSGVSTFTSNNGSGLEIYSYGAIKIGNISANDNGIYGAYFENDSGIVAKPVTISGSNSFQRNVSSGLEVWSLGAIEVNNVKASGNGGNGTYLYNATGASAITVKGANEFHNNLGSGLEVYSKGNIKLSNSDADWNGGFGLFLKNDYLGASGSISLLATVSSALNNASGNGFSGIAMYSNGAVILSNISSVGNGIHGAYINNSTAITPKEIRISGENSFDGNKMHGLWAESKGPIIANNLKASDNGLGGAEGWGAYLSNTGSGKNNPQNITITGNNELRGNYDSGLEVDTYGSITISNLYASDNGWGIYGGYGVLLNNADATSPKSITVNGVNNFYYNTSGGLQVSSLGPIKVSNLESSYNGVYGADLDNSFAGAVGSIALSGYSRFYENYGFGISINSRGAISLANVDAWGNSGFGAKFDNMLGNGGITLGGSNEFSWNGGYGFTAYTNGAITASNLNVTQNVSYGALLENASGTGAITLTGSLNNFSFNGGYGLTTNSRSAIVISNLFASTNANFGAQLTNAAGNASVTLNGTENYFWLNSDFGLTISSRGSISVANLHVETNDGYGALLDNTLGLGGISLNGVRNLFSGNGSYGLRVLSNGTINATNMSVMGNQGYGANLNNSTGTGAVSIAGGISSFGSNLGNGLEVVTNRAITIGGSLSSNGNKGIGVLLDNRGSGSGLQQNISLKGKSNDFKSNNLDGLVVLSFGTITVNNLTAVDNGLVGGGGGAWLENHFNALSPKGITLTGTNSFYENADDGLVVLSLGPIKINNLNTVENGGDGAYVDNQWGVGSVGGITLSGVNTFEGNVGDGLEAYSHSDITLSNVTASWNWGSGAYIDVKGLSSKPANVALTGINTFNGNGDPNEEVGYGLVVYADGNIKINNLTANWNEEDGAYLNNYDYSFTTPSITLTGVNTFLDNRYNGLYFDTAGAVSLSKVVADSNGSSGVAGYADGSINITCASMTDNGVGWSLLTNGVITLKGVFAYGNIINTDPLGSNLVITRSC